MKLANLRANGLGRAWLVVGIELLGLVVSARAARAQGDATSVREQERTALYKQGLALAEAGNWEDALRKFEAVVAIRSAPRALIALAIAEEKAGRWVRAKHTYAKVQPDAQGAGDGRELIRQATVALAALEGRMPRVMIHQPPGLVGATVMIDGTPNEVQPEGIEVDPGVHRIMVSAPGRAPFEQTLQVFERDKRDVFVQFGPADSAGPAPHEMLAPPDDRASSASRGPPLPAWILGGAGVAATAIGLVVRFNGQSEYDAASGDCVAARCPPGDAATRGNAARDQMLVGTVLAAAGGVALGAAGIWWGVSASARTAPNRSDRPSVRAQASPNAWSVQLQGVF